MESEFCWVIPDSELSHQGKAASPSQLRWEVIKDQEQKCSDAVETHHAISEGIRTHTHVYIYDIERERDSIYNIRLRFVIVNIHGIQLLDDF
jgi:hypothetical protein